MEEPLLYYIIYLHKYKDNLCNHKELPLSFYVGFPLFLDKSRNTNTAILAKRLNNNYTPLLNAFPYFSPLSISSGLQKLQSTRNITKPYTFLKIFAKSKIFFIVKSYVESQNCLHRLNR